MDIERILKDVGLERIDVGARKMCNGISNDPKIPDNLKSDFYEFIGSLIRPSYKNPVLYLSGCAEYKFIKDYLNSKYIHKDADPTKPVRSEDEIIEELKDFVQNTDRDYARLTRILEAGKAKDLAEMIECASIKIPDYNIISILGGGADKKVFEAKLKESPDTTSTRALKIFDPSEKGKYYHLITKSSSLEHALIELGVGPEDVYRDTNHPGTHNISPVYHLGQVPGSELVYTVEVKFDSLFVHCKSILQDGQEIHSGRPLPLEKIVDHALQIAYAISKLQTLGPKGVGLIHRDVKWDNVGVINNRLILTDYGVAVLAEPTPEKQKNIFYPPITPPEGFIEDEEGFLKLKHDKNYDVWSLGTLVYQMVTGTVLCPLPTVEGTDYNKDQKAWREIKPEERIRVGRIAGNRLVKEMGQNGVYDQIDKNIKGPLNPLLKGCLRFRSSQRYDVEKVINGLKTLKNL